MKRGLQIGGLFVLLVFLLKATDFAFKLISAPSDISVAIGILIIVTEITFCVAFIPWCVKKMRGRNAPMALLTILVSMATLNSCTRINPGHAGIEVDFYGQDRGVQSYPMRTGVVWYNPVTKDILEYPTFVQTAVWTRNLEEGSPANEEITYNSREGMVFTADISLAYQLIPEEVPGFYVKFRTNDLDTFTHGFLRNIARDAFNEIATQYTADELYGDKKEEAVKKVKEKINEQIERYGVVLEQFGYIGAPRPPDSVVESINAKISATQNAIRTENEVRQAKAEAQKLIAAAEGEAQSNDILVKSLTPALIRWRELQLTEQAIQKWNGVRPLAEGIGSGLLLNISSSSAATTQ
ncbi:MAG: hypothetical protein HY452_00470 [Parcubacteria group bacterium]|nr:hypothetical protein [Parcubacteria group bacterium]